MNVFEKLSTAEMRRLAGFFSSVACPPDSLSLMEVKGFLFAVCCAPALTKPSQWMPEIFNRRTPNYATADEESFVNLALIRLYNGIMAEVNAGTPQLPQACRYKEPCEANFKRGSALHEWCSGFNQGYLFMYDAWEACVRSDEELMAAVGYMVLTLGFFDDDEESRQLLGMAFDVDLPLNEMAPVVRGQMPQVMREFARIGRSAYEEGIDEARDSEGAAEAPRNNVIPFRVPHTAGDAAERLKQAQLLIEEALLEPDEERRVALARRAITISEECAEAYMILAEDASDCLETADRYYQSAMAAARRVLGERAFQSHENLWSLPDIRPYMQAKLGHADSLWELGQRQDALSQYHELLQMNPEDNQGVRYILLIRYLDVDDLAKAEDLLSRYDEESSWWCYTRALHSWIRHGDTAASRKLRAAALRMNAHVPDYLAGKRRMPNALPENYVEGSRNEAVLYVHEARATWRMHEGAVDWLLGGLSAPSKSPAPAKPAARKRAALGAKKVARPSSRTATGGKGKGNRSSRSRGQGQG